LGILLLKPNVKQSLNRPLIGSEVARSLRLLHKDYGSTDLVIMNIYHALSDIYILLDVTPCHPEECTDVSEELTAIIRLIIFLARV
jgi:hypothetical protein